MNTIGYYLIELRNGNKKRREGNNMQIFTNLEQSKRLRDAGFPQNKSIRIHYQTSCNGGGYDCLRSIFAFPEQGSDERKWWAKPCAQEIMEEMKSESVAVRYSGVLKLWIVERGPNWIHDTDLMQALVDAYCNYRKTA